MQLVCKHCNCDSKFVCQTCGAVLDGAELRAEILSELVEVRPLSLEYYMERNKDDIIDHAIFDKVLPFIRSSSGVILFHFISHLKGSSNVAWENGFTIPELMKMTGIKSTGTMSEALAELSDGRPASRTRPEIKGWNVIYRTNKHSKSKYVHGSRWALNIDRILEGEEYKLFHPGKQGRFVRMHHKVIRELLPTLTPDQGVIFLFIYRLTLGCGKEWDTITLNYFTGERRAIEGEPPQEPRHRSGMRDRASVKRVIGQLVEKGLVEVEAAPDPRYGSLYRLNPASFLILESRAKPTPASRETPPASRETPPASRETPPVSRETPPVSRETTPPNSCPKHFFLNEKNETSPFNPNSLDESTTKLNYEPEIVLNVSSNTHSSSLYENGEGITTTLSEGVPVPKRSREERDAILRNVLGIEISFSIKKIHQMMDTGKTTDDELDIAILHKQSDDPNKPKFGPGIYANFLTKKLVNDVPCQLIWKNSPSVGNQSDAAPKSPPSNGNGHGAAPHSPTPNGNDKVAAPLVAAEYLEAWADAKQMLKESLVAASYNNGLHYAKLVKVEGEKFIVSAPLFIRDVLEHRSKNTITRALHSAMKYKGMAGNWTIEFISNEEEKV